MPDEVSGFPTIKLFPAGSKDTPIDYSGSRTVEDLANFVKTNGKYKVDAMVVNETDEDVDIADAESTMPHQAPAATTSGAKEAVKSAASEAAEAVPKEGAEDHDEL